MATEAFNSISLEGGASYRHKWSTGLTSPFSLYEDGQLIESLYGVSPSTSDTTTTAYEAIILGSTGEPPIIELVAAGTTGTPEQILNPPWLTVQWRGDTGDSFYRVEEFNVATSAWVVRDVTQEDDLGYYNYETTSIDDGTTSQLRVIAVDVSGNESEAASATINQVTNPGAPDIVVTYTSADTTITVSAA